MLGLLFCTRLSKFQNARLLLSPRAFQHIIIFVSYDGIAQWPFHVLIITRNNRTHIIYCIIDSIIGISFKYLSPSYLRCHHRQLRFYLHSPMFNERASHMSIDMISPTHIRVRLHKFNLNPILILSLYFPTILRVFILELYINLITTTTISSRST